VYVPFRICNSSLIPLCCFSTLQFTPNHVWHRLRYIHDEIFGDTLSALHFTYGSFLAVLQTGSVLRFVCQHVLLVNLDNDFVYGSFIFKTPVCLGSPLCYLMGALHDSAPPPPLMWLSDFLNLDEDYL
jgi:hypothetical protein